MYARTIAITSAQRSSLMPDVPTFTGAGLAGFEANAWTGFFAPPDTPEALVAWRKGERITRAQYNQVRNDLLALQSRALAISDDCEEGEHGSQEGADQLGGDVDERRRGADLDTGRVLLRAVGQEAQGDGGVEVRAGLGGTQFDEGDPHGLSAGGERRGDDPARQRRGEGVGPGGDGHDARTVARRPGAPRAPPRSRRPRPAI